MTPAPVSFEPICMPRPWGGRKLHELLGKPLPVGQPIGETWELSSLAGAESRVARGPLAGRTLRDLRALWGPALGPADAAGGFPLLIKFLDARENLSIQVHPRPVAGESDAARGVKHECWYVIHAEPRAQLFLGLAPGVDRAALAATAGSDRVVAQLRPWPARAGDCFYLPSGTPHALGAGVVVAEVQTTSDVTYRLYDWGRVGLDGRPRALHLAEALANLRDDVPPGEFRPVAQPVAGPFGVRRRLLACPAFELGHACAQHGEWVEPAPHAAAWIILNGCGRVGEAALGVRFGPGDVLLLPAGGSYPVCIDHAAEWLIA